MKHRISLIQSLLLSLVSCAAFVSPSVTGFTSPPVFSSRRTHYSSKVASSTFRPTIARSAILLNDELSQAVIASRNEFFLWFFGSSGAVGIALGQFPKMYNQVQSIQALKGQGSSQSGAMMGLSPFCGYPEDIAIKDVERVVNNPIPVREIVQRFPNDGSFLAKQGYLTFTAFQAANKNANPLAVRAVFDTFSQSTDTCAPEVAEIKLEEFRGDVKRLSGALLASKATGWASIGVLLFLLGLAGSVAAGHAYTGWFPEWPGGRDFPRSLLDEDGAIWQIPKYWI